MRGTAEARSWESESERKGGLHRNWLGLTEGKHGGERNQTFFRLEAALGFRIWKDLRNAGGGFLRLERGIRFEERVLKYCRDGTGGGHSG